MTDDATAITTVEQAICRIGPQTSVDELADTIGKLDGLGRRVKELKAMFEEVMLARIQESGEVVVGTVRYFAGMESKTICIDVPGTINAVLEATGGDVERFAECLCSEPFKPGATRAVLSDDATARLFRTERKVALKEAEPRKRLLKADTRYLK